MTDQTINLQKLEEEKRKNTLEQNYKKDDNKRKRDEFEHKKKYDYSKLFLDAGKGVTSAAMNALGALAANDPSWYNQVPELSELAGKVQFTVPSGATLRDYDSEMNTAGEPVIGQYTSWATNPGIITYEFIPTIGSQDGSALSPIVAAGQNIFAKIRETISPALPYEAMDVIKLAMLLDSAATVASYAARTYSFLGQTTHTNKYKVNGYLKASMPYASDGELDDFIFRANDFRLAINKFLQQISFVKIPAEFRVITRHSWMSSNIFSDSAETDANVHMFVPSVYYTYNQTRGSLEAHRLPTKLKTVASWVSVFNQIVNTFYNFTDVSRISGDCVKTFGEDKCFSFKGVSVGETLSVEPIYSMEVLSQICNATVGTINSDDQSPEYDTVASACIWEKNAEVVSDNFNFGVLYQSPYPGNQQNVALGIRVISAGPAAHYLRMYTDKVTSDDVMVATRLMFGLEATRTTKFVQSISNVENSLVAIRNITICGSEVLVDPKMFMFFSPEEKYPGMRTMAGDFGRAIRVKSADWAAGDTVFTAVSQMHALTKEVNDMRAFEWAPLLRTVVSVQNAGGTVDFNGVICSDHDMHKVAYIPEQALSNVHYAAIASLFAGVPINKGSSKSYNNTKNKNKDSKL